MRVEKNLQISFRRLPHSPQLIELIERESEHLRHYWPSIRSVRVAVERPHGHRGAGTATSIDVNLELCVPRRRLAARGSNEDATEALHEAFDEAGRALSTLRQRHRSLQPRLVPAAVVG